jgi:hypothetical protein
MNHSVPFEEEYRRVFANSAVTVRREPQRNRESLDKLLPNVAMLVSDKVILTPNPCLKVQVEILDSPDRNEDLACLGLNDITYVVPEFAPDLYKEKYGPVEGFQRFFAKYRGYGF